MVDGDVRKQTLTWRDVHPVWLMLGSVLFFSLMAVCIRVVRPRIPTSEIVFARALVTFIASGWLVQRAGLRVPAGLWRPLLWRGVWGTLGLSAYYVALALLPLALATTLHMAAPLATAVFAAVLLREHLGPRTWLALTVGLLGVAIVAGPSGASAASPLGVAAALASAIFSGLAYTTIRSMAGKIDPRLIVLALPLVTLPVSLLWMVPGAVWPVGLDWLWLLAIGLFTQAGQLCVTYALTRMPAGRATAISYSQVALAFVWGVVLFDETPRLWGLVGAAVIVVAILDISLRRNSPA